MAIAITSNVATAMLYLSYNSLEEVITINKKPYGTIYV